MSGTALAETVNMGHACLKPAGESDSRPVWKRLSLPDKPEEFAMEKVQEIELIPFGSTSSRISMFSVAQQTAANSTKP